MDRGKISRRRRARIVIACLFGVCLIYTLLYIVYIRPVCLTFSQTYSLDPTFFGLANAHIYVVRYVYASLIALFIASFFRTEIFDKVSPLISKILFWVPIVIVILYILCLMPTRLFIPWAFIANSNLQFLWGAANFWAVSTPMYFIFFLFGFLLSPFVYKDTHKITEGRSAMMSMKRKRIATIIIACLFLICVAYTILFYTYLKVNSTNFIPAVNISGEFYAYGIRYIYAALVALLIARFFKKETFDQVSPLVSRILFCVAAVFLIAYVLCFILTLMFSVWAPYANAFFTFFWNGYRVWQSSFLMLALFFLFGLLLSPLIYKDTKKVTEAL